MTPTPIKISAKVPMNSATHCCSSFGLMASTYCLGADVGAFEVGGSCRIAGAALGAVGEGRGSKPVGFEVVIGLGAFELMKGCDAGIVGVIFIGVTGGGARLGCFCLISSARMPASDPREP